MDTKTFTQLTRGGFYDRLFAYMGLTGLDCIRVHYSGGGDSGGVENVEMMPEKVSKKIKIGIEEHCEEELATPIYNRHGSFADGGGYSVDGVVVYDAKQKTVTIQGTDHYWSDDYEDEEEGEGEGEEARDEEWCEDLYEKDDDTTHLGDSDYLFAYMYAKDFLNKRLPEEFHNQLLIAATEKDQHAEDYIKHFG